MATATQKDRSTTNGKETPKVDQEAYDKHVKDLEDQLKKAQDQLKKVHAESSSNEKPKVDFEAEQEIAEEQVRSFMQNVMRPVRFTVRNTVPQTWGEAWKMGLGFAGGFFTGRNFPAAS